MSKIKFFGGAQTVTGSKHYMHIDACGKELKVLFDCGLFQGRKKLREMNWKEGGIVDMPIDYIFLSHAHIDHSGYLPRMCLKGYKNPIICTNTTKELTEILLADSAHIQEEDAKFAKKRGFSKYVDPLPLYYAQNAIEASQLMKGLGYEEPFIVDDIFSFKFFNAGHILGSAFIEMKVMKDPDPFRILFTGDFGNWKEDDIAPRPKIRKNVDMLIMEGTYGNRLHKEPDIMDVLKDSIDFIQKKESVLLIPAFAVERTQNLLFYLYQLEQDNKLPKNIKIFVDSPLAIKATEIYNNRSKEFSKYYRQYNNLYPERTVFTTTPGESKKINELPGPMIIISASGMLEGGRILHHLKFRITNADNILLLTGFQSPGTRGDSIENGADRIKIHGHSFPVKCQQRKITGMSSHGDYEDMIDWLSEFEEFPKKIFLVHGERNVLFEFRDKIIERFGIKDGERIIIPDIDDEYDFNI